MNVIVEALKAEEKRIKSMNGNWSMGKRNKLYTLLEDNGVSITNSVFDLLLFNIQDLILEDGKLYIRWRLGQQSKKVIKLIRENHQLIVDNYIWIMGV